MIIIDKPIIKALEDKTALIANVTIDGKQKELFFKVDNEFASYLTYEVGDAFVIGLLHRAMQMGHDIVSRAPVSENLLYGITKFLIPNLLMGDKNLHHISINADVVPSPKSAGAAGTGLSMGVDSFEAIFENSDDKFAMHKVSYATFFNAGAFYFGENNFYAMIPRVQRCADELGLKLIIGDSNIHKIILGDYEITHTFYSLFCIFALRKLFSIYYYASAYPFINFSCFDSSVIGKGSASSYDLLTFHCVSDSQLKIYSAGAGIISRIEKTRIIMDKDIVQKNLDVCMSHGDKNCGLCLKCRRTMLQLYILGKLNNFKDVFPVDYFYSHISEYIDWMIDNKSSSNLERETYQAYVDKFGVPNHSKQRFLKCLFYKK